MKALTLLQISNEAELYQLQAREQTEGSHSWYRKFGFISKLVP